MPAQSLARKLTKWSRLQGYSPAKLRMDLIGGFTVALVLIPQSMAYAQLAGLPAYYGLYAAFLPPIVAALFGSSMQLATGPVAVVSLMTAASLEPLAAAGSQAFVGYALLLALLVGLFQFLLGALRLGVLVNFISHPVITGFSNAAALIIASSQLAKFLGVSVDNAELHVQTVARVVSAALHHLHWPSLALGLLAFAVMFVMKRINPRSPYVLTAVALATAISWLTGFEHNQRVPLAQIESRHIAGAIKEFNWSLNELKKLRLQQGQALESYRKLAKALGPNSAEAFQKKAEAAVLGLRMEEMKDLAGFARRDIRWRLLTRAEVKPGEWRFFEKGRAPAGLAKDGRVWRIKVGKSPLDAKGLPLIGGGEVLGHIPAGLPAPRAPSFSLEAAWRLLPYAAIISLLGFMEAISIAKAMASQTGQRIDPNRELIGQGLANIVGSMVQSYPVSGSFSRSAVNLQAGAQSWVSSAFTSLAVLAALLFFTPLLYHLPLSVLAAVIMMAVVGLVNISGFVHAWKAQWYDGAISVITFVATLAFAPHLDRGIFIGVGLSLLVFLYKSMRPEVVNLSVGPDGALHDAAHSGLAQCRHLAMIRFEGPLFFANASFLEEQIRDRRLSMPELRRIHIAAEGISEIDASGEAALSHIVDRVRRAGFGISFSGLHWTVRDVLERTGLLKKIGRENIFPDEASALKAIYGPAHSRSSEGDACPLAKALHGMESDDEKN